VGDPARDIGGQAQTATISSRHAGRDDRRGGGGEARGGRKRIAETAGGIATG